MPDSVLHKKIYVRDQITCVMSGPEVTKNLIRGALIIFHAWIFLILIPGSIGSHWIGSLIPSWLIYTVLFLGWLLLARVFYNMFR